MKGWFIQAIRQVVRTAPPRVYISPWVSIGSDGDVLANGDAIGRPFEIPVPVSGIIQSATLLDRDDENSQIDVALFDSPFTAVAANLVYAISDEDGRRKIFQLNFTTFNDNVNSRDSSVENIGKAYRVKPKSRGSKMGRMWCQGITRATPTIALGSEPLLRLEIYPDEPVD